MSMTPRRPAPMSPGHDRQHLENEACGPPSQTGRGRRPAGRSAAGRGSACCAADRRCLPRRTGIPRRRSRRRTPAAGGWRRNRAPSCSWSGETSAGRRPGRPADPRTTATVPRSRALPSRSVPSLSRRPAPRRAHQPGRRRRCRVREPPRQQHRVDRRG